MRDPAFDAIVARLCADDPEFTDRMRKLGGPPSKKRAGAAVLLWMLAPLCIVFGGWTGLLIGVIAVAYGSHLKWSGSMYPASAKRPSLPKRRQPGAPF